MCERGCYCCYNYTSIKTSDAYFVQVFKLIPSKKFIATYENIQASQYCSWNYGYVLTDSIAIILICQYIAGALWGSMHKPHTSVFNVEFCRYGRYVHTFTGLYISACPATCIAWHYYHHVRLLCCPIPSLSSSNYVQWWDHAWATLTERDREMMAAKTRNKRATALHCLHVATTLMLTPQGSAFT